MMETPTSFTSRRPAANTLPAFTLPPPPEMVPRVPGDGLSPLSSGLNSGSSQGSQAGGSHAYYHGNWQSPSYTLSSTTPNAGSSLLVQPPYHHTRPAYSPPGGPGNPFPRRSSQSPAHAASDALPAPSSHQEMPPFPTGLPSGGNASHGPPGGYAPSTLPPQHPGQMQIPILGPQSHPPPPPGSSALSEGFRHQPPNSYGYAPSSTPQQSPYPATYAPQHSSAQPSPTTSASGPRGLASLTSQPPGPLSGMAPPIGYGPRPTANAPYSYPMPGMPVPMPGEQMAVLGSMGGVGGMGIPGYGHPGQLGHLYTPHHSQQPPQNDRPFKCDQCPQSFNRNHDLKRHKRIHLAVKPFPCTFCDKSFSRKDALKRHRLVKGCGQKAEDAAAATTDGSPPDRSDVVSDDTEESPKMSLKRVSGP